MSALYLYADTQPRCTKGLQIFIGVAVGTLPAFFKGKVLQEISNLRDGYANSNTPSNTMTTLRVELPMNLTCMMTLIHTLCVLF